MSVEDEQRADNNARALDADVVCVALKVVKFVHIDTVSRIADDVEQKGAFALLCFRRAAAHNQIANKVHFFFVCKNNENTTKRGGK